MAKKGGGKKGPQGPPQVVWSPKSVKLTGWTAPNRPHWKLAELLAMHKGKTSWRQTMVSDDHLHADYVQMGAGEKTARRMHPDTRAWWVVQDGQIRFTIDGQEPFVASKGYLVQVPYRAFYQLETVGDKPSLRFEVNIAHAKTMYPATDPMPVLKGFDFVKTTVASKGTATVLGLTSTLSSPAPRPSPTSSSETPRRRRPWKSPARATSIRSAPSSGSSCSARWNTRWKAPV